MAFDRRKFLRRTLAILPKKMRFFYLRRAIKVSNTPPPMNLSFKIAETKEELEQAYRILHDSYVESGFQEPEVSGMRIVKYFALPTTTTLIALWDGRVVGTMSIIRKGPFGLPIEDIFDLEKVSQGGKVVAEVSSLAIAAQFRHRRGALFLPMCKFFYLYAKKFMHLDRVVIAVNPAWADFYEGLLDFTPLDKKVVGSYNFANGAPAVGLYSDVTTWEDRFIKLYNHRKPSQNFYHYFVEQDLSCLKFPLRYFQKAMDPVMTPEMLNYFFREKSWVFNYLSQTEILALHSCYPYKEYRLILPKLGANNPRQNARYVVHATGEAGMERPFRVLDVSFKGMRLQGPLPQKTNFDMFVQVSAGKTARLRGLIHWMDPKSNSYGVEILEHDDIWREYIEHLSADFTVMSADSLHKKAV